MQKQRVESYIAYPEMIPYQIVSVLGFMLKWFIVLTCAASVPFTLCRCYRVIEQVAHTPQATHSAPLERPEHAPHAKGHRP